MGFLKVQFGEAKINWVEGYRIAAAFTPGQGTQGNIVVACAERIEAATPFPSTPKLTKEGAAARGTLELTDDERVYKLEKIDYIGAEVGATRRERMRTSFWRYDKAVTTEENPS